MKLAAIALVASLCAALGLVAAGKIKRASLWTLHMSHKVLTKLGFSHATISQFARIGPCAAIFFLLPGGSILAVLVWLYGRRHYSGHLGFAHASAKPAASGVAKSRLESENSNLIRDHFL
jgi:hypothetical protein